MLFSVRTLILILRTDIHIAVVYVLNAYTYVCGMILFSNFFFFCQVIIKMFLEKRFSFTNLFRN